ncbi:MAG: 50S ribosomal protein L29 [Deltaproteobacteria bacterium]|nr:50S ribosomal protein L29 [Deltaproteobacteria bacterium]
MKVSEIKSLSDEELNQKPVELSHELFNLRFQHASRQLENTARLSQIAKDIARVKTVIRERRK